jgi:hypothetical protein
MAIINKELQYKLLTAGAALAAGALVKVLLNSSWKAIRKSEPPQNPDSPETSWNDAISWTIASSVAVGLAGLIARRGAAQFFERPFGGEEPLL